MNKQISSGADDIGSLIRTIRGQKVILDYDLARIFSVPTFRFNEAVKRNRGRFPDDLLFADCLNLKIVVRCSGRNKRVKNEMLRSPGC